MKYLKLFESHEEYYEEITIDKFNLEKMKALSLEGSRISKEMIEDYCQVKTIQKDFSRRYNTSHPNWRSEMGPSRKYTELQIDFNRVISDEGHPINKKLILSGEIDVYLLPEDYFLVRFYREWKGDTSYWNKKGEKVSFYKCDQIDGLKKLIEEIQVMG